MDRAESEITMTSKHLHVVLSYVLDLARENRRRALDFIDGMGIIADDSNDAVLVGSLCELVRLLTR